jgi:hypothetical protein
MKRLIIFLLLAFVLSTGLVSANWCYQESANIMNQSGTDDDCGLNYDGLQTSTSQWRTSGGGASQGLTHDGSFGTYEIPLYGASNVYVDVTYIKPIGASSAVWTYKNFFSTDNLTIPSSCWNHSQNNITLRYEAYYSINPSYLNLSCLSDSGYESLFYSNTGSDSRVSRFYEEGVYWYIQEIPEVESVYTIPDNNFLFQDVTGYCNVSDDNGANVDYEYLWFVNDVSFSGGQTYGSCVQEDANTSNFCGAKQNTLTNSLYTNGIDNEFFTYLTNPNNMFDDDWSTYASFSGLSLTSNIYYKIPEHTSSADYTINVDGVNYTNTIPSECISDSWPYSDSVNLIFTMQEVMGVDKIGINCMGDMQYKSVLSLMDSSNARIYDEEMVWSFEGGFEQNVSQNLSTLNKELLSHNDNVTFSCRGYDGIDYSSWVNTSTIDFYESIISFNAFEKITNNTLTGVSYYPLRNITQATTHDPDSFSNDNYAWDGNSSTYAEKIQINSGSDYTWEFGKTFPNASVGTVTYDVYGGCNAHDSSDYHDIYLQTYDGSTWTTHKVIKHFSPTTEPWDTRERLNGSVEITSPVQGIRLLQTTDGYTSTSDHYFYIYELNFNYAQLNESYDATEYWDAGEYTLRALKDGYYPKDQTFTITKGDDKTLTFTDMYNSLVTITATNTANNSSISDWNGYITTSGFNESYVATGESHQIGLINNLTYSSHIDATGYANNFGVDKNFTINNTTYDLEHILYTADSMKFNFYNLTSNNLITANVDFVVKSDEVTYNLNTSTGTYLKEDMLAGTYLITATSSGFEQGVQYASINGTFQEVNIYLDETPLQEVTFTIIDNYDDYVSGATITFTYNINGSLVTIAQKQTDFSGTAVFDLDPSKTYGLIVSKEGYTPFTGVVTPTQSSYTLNIDEIGSEPLISVFNDVYMNTNFVYYAGNDNVLAYYTLTSASGLLQYYGMSVTYNGVDYFVNRTGTPAGGTEFFNITPLDLNIQDSLNVSYWFKATGYDLYYWNEVYLIPNITMNNNSIREDVFSSEGMPDWLKVFIAALIILVFLVIGFSITRSMTTATIFGLLGLGIVWFKEYLPKNYCLVAAIVLIVILIVDNIGGRS